MIHILRAFAGTASAPTATFAIQAVDYTRTVTDPADATCSITFASDGSFSGIADNGVGYSWLSGGAPGDYSVILTTAAGTLSSGTAGSYQNLGTSRTFAVTRTSVGTKQWSGSVTIRRDIDSVVMAGPTNISLTATVESSDSGSGGGGFGGGHDGNNDLIEV